MWVNKRCSSFYMLVQYVRTMWGFLYQSKQTLIIFCIFKQESWFVEFVTETLQQSSCVGVQLVTTKIDRMN